MVRTSASVIQKERKIFQKRRFMIFLPPHASPRKHNLSRGQLLSAPRFLPSIRRACGVTGLRGHRCFDRRDRARRGEHGLALSGGLLKQRFRWSFGTLQCLWKHRRALFDVRRPVLGFIALPQIWLFQIFLTAIKGRVGP